MTDAEIGFVERLLDRMVPIDFREEATEPPSTGTDSSWASGWTSAYVRVPAVGQRVRIKEQGRLFGTEGAVDGVRMESGVVLWVKLDCMHGMATVGPSNVEAIGENPRYILVPKEGA